MRILMDQVSKNFLEILESTSENVNREGLRDTPDRASKAFQFLTSGYNQNPYEILNNAIFEEEYDQMIIVRDIEFYSLCEHHILPFFGKCHVGYIPNGRVIGLSKIPRLVDIFSRRLQVQERLTEQIADSIIELLEPLGAGVIMEAQHTCMSMRGVQKQDSYMVTNSMKGIFRKQFEPRKEFLSMISTKI